MYWYVVLFLLKMTLSIGTFYEGSYRHIIHRHTSPTNPTQHSMLKVAVEMSMSSSTTSRPSSSEARRLRVEQLRQKHASRRSLLVGKEEEEGQEGGVKSDPMMPTPTLQKQKGNDDVLDPDEEGPSSSSRSVEEEQSVAITKTKKKQSGRKRFSPPGIERGLAALVSSRAGGSNSHSNDGVVDDDYGDEEAQREISRHHKRQKRTKSSSSSSSFKTKRGLSSRGASRRSKNREINISPRATDEDASLFNIQDDQEASLDRIRAGVASLSLLLQGILAGFAISTLLTAIPNRDTAAFVADYAQHANGTRRFYFLVVTACLSSSLCLVVPPRDSLVGGVTGAATPTRDVIGTLPEGMVKWWWMVAVCYFAGLILTLPIAVVDVKLAMLDDGIGPDDVRLWRSLSIIRSICCLLAWVLVCWQQSKAYERRREILKWYN